MEICFFFKLVYSGFGLFKCYFDLFVFKFYGRIYFCNLKVDFK